MKRDEWWRAFTKILRQMPDSVELVIVGNDVEMRTAGSLRQHLDRDSGFGFDSPAIESLHHSRVRSYSEGA